MKKLYFRLAVTFAVSTCFIAAVFTMSLYQRSLEENRHTLEQLLDGVESSLDAVFSEQAERLELFREEYLSRARTVEYIVSNDFDAVAGGPGLAVLRDLMNVQAIALLDGGGQILTSSGDASGADPAQILAFLDSNDSFAVCTDAGDDTRAPSYFYVLVRSQSDRFAAVRLDADVPALGLLSRKALVHSTLRHAATEYETSILVLRQDDAEILGMTENNTQSFQVSGHGLPEELSGILRAVEQRQTALLRINGAYSQISVRSLDGMYLVAFTALDKVFGTVARTVLEGLLGIALIGILTVFLLHYHIARMERDLSAAQTEARYDKLTGLYNRSGFEQRIGEFLEQEQPSGALVLFDLDNFKRINDFEGHPEGDRVLKQFAACLSAGFRKSDVVGRLGGDEFIALIPNRMPEAALGEKLGAILSDARAALGQYYEKYEASVSIGAVPVDGTIRAYEALYQCADAALYIAKNLGKNRYYINSQLISCPDAGCAQSGASCPTHSRTDGEDGRT